MTKTSKQQQQRSGSEGGVALTPVLSKSAVKVRAMTGQMPTVSSNSRRVGRPAKTNLTKLKAISSKKNANKQRGRGRPRKSSGIASPPILYGINTSILVKKEMLKAGHRANRTKKSSKRKTKSEEQSVLGLQSATDLELQANNPTLFSSSGPQAMASQLMKQLPSRS